MNRRTIQQGQPDSLRAAMAAEQKARAAQAQITQFVHLTAMHVYGHLAANAVSRDPESLRALAQQAKDAAPYLAEAFGMVQVHVKPQTNTDEQPATDRGGR